MGFLSLPQFLPIFAHIGHVSRLTTFLLFWVCSSLLCLPLSPPSIAVLARGDFTIRQSRFRFGFCRILRGRQGLCRSPAAATIVSQCAALPTTALQGEYPPRSLVRPCVLDFRPVTRHLPFACRYRALSPLGCFNKLPLQLAQRHLLLVQASAPRGGV